MPSRVHCPECRADFAYSPALLGRSYQCGQCGHPFTVNSPPAEELPVARFADPDAGPPPLAPPPLPPRRTSDRSRRDDEPDDRSRRRILHRDRPSGAAALMALVAAFLFGFLVLAIGIGYLLWPSPSQSTGPAVQGPAPPPTAEAPVAGDRPRPLDEVMRQAPRRDGGPVAERPGMAAQPPVGKVGPQPPGAFPAQPPGGFLPQPPGDFGPPGFPGQPGVMVPQPLFPGPGFAQPRGTNAAVFPPAPPPVRAVGEGPKFIKVEPLPIKPSPFNGDRAEVDLRGRVESVVVAGGGRYLLLHVPSTDKLVVFDVSEAKAAREIEVTDKDAKVAGGMNLFVIYRPGDNTFERWRCDKLERQFAGKAPIMDPVRALAMGAASNGPLVAAIAGTRGNQTIQSAATAFLDPATFKEVQYERDISGQRNMFGLGRNRGPLALRVSPDGLLASGWDVRGAPGGETHRFAGGRVIDRWQLAAPHPLLPAPKGDYVFGAGRVVPWDLGGGLFPAMGQAIQYVPAVQREFYLAVRRTNVRSTSIEVFKGTQEAAVATFADVPDFDWSRADSGLDQSAVLVPDARVLITVAGPNRAKLVLRRVELK